MIPRVARGSPSASIFLRSSAFLASLALLLLASSCIRILPHPGDDPPAGFPLGTQSVPHLPAGTVQPGQLDQSAALRQDSGISLPDLSSAPSYKLDLQIADDLGSYNGLASITYPNAEDAPLDHLYFRLLANADPIFGDGLLQVESLVVAGSEIEPLLSLDDTLLEISLPTPLQPAEEVQVEIGFQGLIPTERASAGYGVHSLTEGVLTLAGWYPLAAVYDDEGWNLDPISYLGDAVYADISTVSLHLSAPDDLVIVATGVELSRTQSAGRQEVQFVSGPVREFTLTMSPDFNLSTTTHAGVNINAYHLPGHERSNRQALSVAVDSLAIYDRIFGPYPYRELDVVEVPLQRISGVEYPGIIFIRSSYYASPNDSTFPVVVAHEVAHQWWYNVVGNDVFEDPWMDEALTTFVSSLYFEVERGDAAREALTAYWQNDYQSAVEGAQDHRITRSLEYFEEQGNPGLYGAIVYSKGALFFAALRAEIGDEAFFQALWDYYHDYNYRIARPQDLLSVFERTSARSLDDFYQEWLYTP